MYVFVLLLVVVRIQNVQPCLGGRGAPYFIGWFCLFEGRKLAPEALSGREDIVRTQDIADVIIKNSYVQSNFLSGTNRGKRL
jgi:hypothetical protein